MASGAISRSELLSDIFTSWSKSAERDAQIDWRRLAGETVEAGEPPEGDEGAAVGSTSPVLVSRTAGCPCPCP